MNWNYRRSAQIGAQRSALGLHPGGHLLVFVVFGKIVSLALLNLLAAEKKNGSALVLAQKLSQ